MKANEAPDKIYINSNLENRTWLLGKGDTSFIEYTRTDAFIEIAARYLNCRLYDRVEVVNFGTTLESIMLKKEFVDDFKNYMKGE